MGGYGAVLFAKPLGTTRILGLSPRFQFIDIDRAGHRKCREQLNLRPILNCQLIMKEKPISLLELKIRGGFYYCK